MNPQAVCSFVAGQLDAWRGLPGVQRGKLPDCLGPRVAETTIRFRYDLLAVDTHTLPSGRSARVYWVPNGGTVEMIELIGNAQDDPARWTASLGSPDGTHTYSDSERVSAGFECTSVEESIWATRGLALAIGRDAAGGRCMLRLRGFQPVTVERYLDERVRFDPEAL